MRDNGSTRRIICFGEYEADLSSGQLRKRGVKVRLPGQSFQALTILLEYAGQTVTREEMRRQLWPKDVFVDFDNNLNTVIARLREVLNDSAEHPRFIETLPKHGYRFIADLYEPAQAPKRPLTRKARLVVLPFTNLSGDPSQDYFSDGMTEEMITELAGLAPEHLGVIARTTAMHYKGSHKDVARIGRELGVDYVLEGSVRRAENQIRINAQLIQVKDQAHLWAKRYDVELPQVFSTQNAIAHSVAERLDIATPVGTRPGRDRPLNPEAHDAYLRGLYQFSRFEPNSLVKAVECFSRAIEQYPAYAQAHARLALAYVVAGFFEYVAPATIFPLAEAAAEKSLELDETLAETRYAVGLVRWFHTWDLPAAEREFKRAVEFGPNDPLAHCLLAMFLSQMKADHEEAAIEFQLAQELDPLSISIRTGGGWAFYFARQHDRAIGHARETLEMDENCLHAWWVLGLSACAKLAYSEAIGAFEQATKRFGDPFSIAALGMAYGFVGEREKACTIARNLEEMAIARPVPTICHSWIHMGLGDNGAALDLLEKAYLEHDAQVLYLRTSPLYDPLRADPGFGKILARLPR
jgi:TolB-like protein/Tfp pilus assembly protein PilF